MNLKIKRVLAFAMTLTMLLGCFVFGTSAADAKDAPTNAPGGGTGDIKYYGTCTQDNQQSQQFFVVRDDSEGNVTMYIYGDGTNKGWFRPLSNKTHWGTTNLGDDGVEWCQENVTKVVIDSGVTALAGISGDSKGSFYHYTALKYVEVNTKDIDAATFMQRPSIFEGCDLKAIYTTGSSVVDGTADLTYLTAVGRGNNEDGPFKGLSGIETVLLGDKVQFFNPRTFMGMTDLKTVKISATNTSNITTDSVNTKLAAATNSDGAGPMTLPEGAMFECENEEMANKLSEVTYASANIVTYPGKESMAAISEKTSTDGKIKYSVAADGDGWCLTVGATESNTDKEITKLSTAVGEFNDINAYITKVKFDESVRAIGEGVCNEWTAIKEVVLPAGNIIMNGKETFMNCSTITSIHPANIASREGVADLSTVTAITGGWWKGWAFQNVPISTFIIGEKVSLDCTNVFSGCGAIKRIVFLGTDADSYKNAVGDVNMLCFGVTDIIIERWNSSVAIPYLKNGDGGANNMNEKHNTVSSKYVGYQTKTSKDDAEKNDIRFIAVIAETEAFEKVGFDIEVTGDSGKNKNGETTVVYQSISGTGKNGTFTYTAKELGGKYIFTITISGVPSDTAIEFTVKPYVIKTGASEKTYGASGTVTIGGAN